MVKDELGLCVVKRQNLGKTMEAIKSHASDILTLTLQYTDVEEHLLLVETSLEKRSKEIESKEIELLNRSLTLEERAKVVEAAEAKVDDLEKEIEEKEKELSFLKNQIESCLGESKTEEMRLNEVKKSVEECMVELSVEKEHLCKTQSCSRELEEEIERKTKDLTLIGERIVESEKELKMVEEQVDTQKKLIATQSSKLISKEKELDSLRESIRVSHCDLEVSEQKIQSFNSLMMETSQQIESKAKELENIQKLVKEGTCELNANLLHYDSIKLLIQEHSEELVIREKKYDEMSEAIRKLEMEIKSKEKTLERAESFIHQLSRKQHESENTLLLTERDLETTSAELESKKKRLQAMEDTVRKVLQDMESKVKELNSLEPLITEKKNQVEAEEKKLQHLQNSSEEINKKVEMKQEELSLIKKMIMEFSQELESNKKEHTKIEKSIMELNAELISKECKLNSLKKRIQQLPSQAPITNRSASHSPSVQEIAGLSQLDCEDGLMDNEIPASLSHNEVLTGLQLHQDPARFVLNLVEEALLGSNHQGELGLAESTVENLVIVFEELTRIPRAIDSRLHLDASKLASQWIDLMRTGTRRRVSSLEALAFLQLIVAYRLMERINREQTVKLALSVAHFKQAPKLFDSLGLSNSISDVVKQLMNSRQYIPAIRFMLMFNHQPGLSPLDLLKEEINGLRRSAMGTRRFNPQVEDKDAGKLRDIIELIADFKLEIDLPGDLIAKVVLSREILNQNQCFASPVALQPQVRTPEVQMQAAPMATYAPNTSQATNFSAPSPNPQVIEVETYQARGLAPFQARFPQQQAGFKRPRVEPCILRPLTRTPPCVLRPRFEPPRTGRF